ncbi:MAG: hypothetical protein IPO14_00205 [Saprospiraceae bacterium]|nr:hypothetical protein [Saprospiraceae bacterium]
MEWIIINGNKSYWSERIFIISILLATIGMIKAQNSNNLISTKMEVPVEYKKWIKSYSIPMLPLASTRVNKDAKNSPDLKLEGFQAKLLKKINQRNAIVSLECEIMNIGKGDFLSDPQKQVLLIYQMSGTQEGQLIGMMPFQNIKSNQSLSFHVPIQWSSIIEPNTHFTAIIALHPTIFDDKTIQNDDINVHNNMAELNADSINKLIQ